MANDYTADSAGIERMSRSAWLRDEMVDRAEYGAQVARTLAAPHILTGDFVASLHAEGGTEDGRVAGFIVSDDPAAVSIEFGHTTEDGSRVDGLHVLARAADIVERT